MPNADALLQSAPNAPAFVIGRSAALFALRRPPFLNSGGHQQVGRLDTYTNQIRKQHRTGILSFVAYYTSVRNEERTSWTRYKEIVRDRLRAKTNIGDALVADPGWDWQSGKRTVSGNEPLFAISPHQLSLSHFVRSRLEQLRADRTLMKSIALEWSGDAPKPPKLIIGPVASGSAVLADGATTEAIKAQHRNLCGVDMEVYGVYSAADTASFPRPAAVSVKAVSDFADSAKSDDHQGYAAYVSAMILRFFFERYAADIRKHSA